MMGSDHHERNLSMSDAELIEQALSHPPLELPSKTSIDDAIRCAKLVKMRQGYSEKTGELAAWIERHPNEWRVLVSTFRDGLPALVAREEAPAAAGEDAIKAACIAWHRAKGSDPFNVLYNGAWCGSFPHQTGPERWTFTVPAMKEAIAAYLRAQPPARSGESQ